MDLKEHLFVSHKKRRLGGASTASLVAHSVLIGAAIFAGAHATHTVNADTSKIAAFITEGAAPPPPPPPPPPAQSSAPQSQPKITPPTITPQPTPVFTQPLEIPKELPKVEPVPTKDAVLDLTPSAEPVPATTADVGGVAGGVPGGVAGGQVGGVVGGEVGGQVGGVVGGKLGGEVGGTGTGNEGTGSGGTEAPAVPAPEPSPDTPMRVGGSVKAPVVVHRSEPEYTESARSARITGVVIVEAIIDKEGNVDQARVLKGLSMGLGESAVKAVRQWKFKPGTLNGEPVATIFNLTVNFKLN